MATVIAYFMVGLSVFRWRLDEDPPAATIGASTSPFAGLLKIITTALQGTEVDEEETAILVLTRDHLQNLDDYEATLRKFRTALRYSFPLRFCNDVSRIAEVVVERLYRRYDVETPEPLTGDGEPKFVVELDLVVSLRDKEDDNLGEIGENQAGGDDLGEIENGDECEFEKLSGPWGNLRRCVGLFGICEEGEVWKVQQKDGDPDEDDTIYVGDVPDEP